MNEGTLEAAIEEAAEHLPYGWTIQLCVEQGAGWVELITPYGNAMPINDTPDATLAEAIKEAVASAVEGEKELKYG